MTSIRDIAERAGASVATVSRVINDSGYVSAETRALVQQAIADLDYMPNAGARRLRSRGKPDGGGGFACAGRAVLWHFGACD